MQQPQTRTVDLVDDFHGTKVPDPFRWLEDADSAEVRSWVAEQNAYTASIVDAIGLKPQLVEELTAVWSSARRSTPIEAGGKRFDLRNPGTEDHDTIWVTDEMGERPLVNAERFGPTAAITTYKPSPSGTLIVVGVNEGGGDWNEMVVIDVATGEQHPETIGWTKMPWFGWLPDDSGFVYSGYDAVPSGAEHSAIPTGQSIRLHQVGTDQATDEILVACPDSDSFIYPSVSDDGRWIVIETVRATVPTGIYVRPIGVGEITCLVSGDALHRYAGSVGDTFYVHTNDGAERGKVVAYELADGSVTGPLEVVPQQSESLATAFQTVHLAQGALACVYERGGSSILKVFPLDGSDGYEAELPSAGSIGIDVVASTSSPVVRLAFSSYVRPLSVVAHDVSTRMTTVEFTPTTTYDPDEYVLEASEGISKDGTAVPMTIIRKRGTDPDGTRPTIITGYGGFGVAFSMLGFQPWFIPWVERGGVVVTTCLRGGGELGEQWHLAGTRERKQNVFDDVIGCAEAVIAKGWTSSDHLALTGSSNGGLLAAAVLMQRPELFAAVVPEVGLLDCLRYHLFTGARAWIPEYGCSEETADFQWLFAYSPVHNTVAGTEYPPTLIATGEHDTRVPPGVHSYKLAAALQAAQGGGAPIALRVQAEAGHGHGKPVSMQIDERADLLAFMLGHTI